MSSRRAGVAVHGVVVAAAAVVACVDLSGGGYSAGVSFGRLPSPSVVVGDTMRDSLGIAARLTATVLGDRRVRFIPLDTTIRVDTNNFLTARSRDTSATATNQARVIADAGGSLQTSPRSMTITVRPDQLVPHGSAVPTLQYDPARTAADTANRSAALEVRLRHLYVAGEMHATARDTVVRAFVVRFEIVSVPGIADSAHLVSDLGALTAVDTTDQSGVASRRVRVYPRAGATAGDSVIVRARVWYRGTDVPGSPVRIVLPLRKR